MTPPSFQPKGFEITAYIIHAINLLTTSTYSELIKTEAKNLGLAIDPFIIEALINQSPILAGTSGGKDSDCLAILLDKFLKAIHYTGEKILIHNDLSEIEHVESIDQVRRLATFIDWELMIVRREKGGLLDRYTQRWHDNCRRWANLECVNLISPFPQANQPWCRGEVKVAPITQAAVKKFPGKLIINAVGIRGEESAQRAKKPISKENDKLTRANGTHGRDWFPLLNTTIETVWLTHHNANFPRHIQYDRGNERVSCSFCFLASLNDWQKGAQVTTNYGSYHKLCTLEIESGFSYRQNNWLIDVRPQILPEELQHQLTSAKEKARARKLIEGRVPKQLLFAHHGGRKSWPSSQPNMDQCETLAAVRQDMTSLMGKEITKASGHEIKYTNARDIYERYAELITQRQAQLTRTNKRNKLTSNPATEASANPQLPGNQSPTAVFAIPPPTASSPTQCFLF